MIRLIVLELVFMIACCTSVKVCIVEGSEYYAGCSSLCLSIITLSGINEYLQSNNMAFQFLLCSPQLTLEHQIIINSISTFFLMGYSETRSIVQCNGNSSGLKLVNVANTFLENVEFRGCGAEYNSTTIDSRTQNLLFNCSIYVLNCSNAEMINVAITNSNGVGMAIFDTNGHVYIANSTFENNTIHEGTSGGGGLYIEFTFCTPGGVTAGICDENTSVHRNDKADNSSYVIDSCLFRNNAAIMSKFNVKLYHFNRASGIYFKGLGKGGGLAIRFRGNSKHNTLNITNCQIIENSARWGGGLGIALYDSSKFNNVSVWNTQFIENEAKKGGGGLDIGCFYYYRSNATENVVTVTGSKFMNNTAEQGGGLIVLSNVIPEVITSILFDDCQWEANTAVIGAAVHANVPTKKEVQTVGLLPSITFKNSKFCSNKILAKNSSVEGKGAFSSVGIDVIFEGSTFFSDNNGSALLLISANANFTTSSHVEFTDNEGTSGGALMMYGEASLEINDNSTFNFTQNRAITKGGAISQTSYSVFDYVGSRRCFIRYLGDKVGSDRDISFTFQDNQVGMKGRNTSDSVHLGHSIYTTTLRPCYEGECPSKNVSNFSTTFNCIANFSFREAVDYDISTDGMRINTTNNLTIIYVIPGQTVSLPIRMIDELNNEVSALYHVSLSNGTYMTAGSEYISDNRLQFYGQADSQSKVTIKSTNLNEAEITLEVHLYQCPPGFVHTVSSCDDLQSAYCDCAATSSKPLYAGIANCNRNNFTADMKIGFWFGYLDRDGNGLGKERNLISGYCPHGYCTYNDSITLLTLPNSTNKSELDIILCGYSRTGRMCGQCQYGYSSYYHSFTNGCYQSKNCDIGWLIYIISEIIPVTIFFAVFLFFSINFTTGAINGLIYYFQITDLTGLNTRTFVRCPSAIRTLLDIYHFITGIFNLKFFKLERLSFCLWQGAKTLDIVVFKYVTIIYALMLVIMIVLTLRVCNMRRITRRFPRVFSRHTNVKSTVIHGLSGFLILCYSDCTQLSLVILTPAWVHTDNDAKKVVFYSGELEFFGKEHMGYAVPALVSLLVIAIIPPVLLMFYPLCYRVFGFFKMSESRFVKVLCRCIPLEDMKPIFDSFQSGFKDNYRFFSGFYFIYRLLPLIASLIAHDLSTFYVLLIIFSALILCLHTITQPYKVKGHNFLDGLIFTNLLIINALTLYNFMLVLELKDNSHTINIVCIFHTLLLYIPLIYFTAVCFWHIFSKMAEWFKHKDDSNQFVLSESLLFNRAEERVSTLKQYRALE